MPLSGTSMASPHVAGAVAVLQSRAQASLGRRLTPAEVRQVLIDSATPMTGRDGLLRLAVREPAVRRAAARQLDGMTGQPYARWQVGAGYLNVADALRRVDSLGATAPAGATPASGTAGPALPAPSPGATATPVRTTLPSTQPGGQSLAQQRAAKRRRAAYRRCVTTARKKKTSRARARAKARCKARYG